VPHFPRGIEEGIDGYLAAPQAAEPTTEPQPDRRCALRVRGGRHRSARRLPRADVEEVAAWFPDAEVLVYDGTGHAPQWEEPDRFARDLAAFLARRP
jgi:pimeloyl-ACP methyl ester carboxylesterase